MKKLVFLIVVVFSGGIFSGCIDLKQKGKDIGMSAAGGALDALEKKVESVDKNSTFGQIIGTLSGLLVAFGVYKKAKKDVHTERNVGRVKLAEESKNDIDIPT